MINDPVVYARLWQGVLAASPLLIIGVVFFLAALFWPKWGRW